MAVFISLSEDSGLRVNWVSQSYVCAYELCFLSLGSVVG